jgi:formylglycine-generating enzyme required for sulfatase activity
VYQPAQYREHRDRAVALLEQAVTAGLSRCWDVRVDARLRSLHDHPGYQALVARFHPDLEYAAVWHASLAWESAQSHGLVPPAHRTRCRQLAAEGYRPVSLSVAQPRAGRPLVTASVWHRPFLAERDRETQAQRQAGAGVVLLKLGLGESVWPLLKHSAYPEARTRLTMRLGPAGIDARIVIDRLLAEPDVSIRRALIVALGGYTAAGVPAELRLRLLPRLLGWYRDDPDPGIHAAIDWLLRHGWEGPDRRPLDWRQGEELDRLDATASRERQRPEKTPRRWYVNGQLQTFTVVDGHSPFLMGSPRDERGRHANEKLHWRRIGRRFAIGTKPVTVAQFGRFLKAHPEVKHRHNQQSSPTPDSPVGDVTWYEAAQYCRWLSEQEGVPPEQMVYPTVAVLEQCKDGQRALRLSANYLARTGYRLPTEAEWEYACRSGARTSNYYGSSGAMFPHYAWFGSNSRKRTWPVGQKRPSDLGLFDMHGNVLNWCQDRALPYPAGTIDWPAPDQEDARDVSDRPDRQLRAGSFVTHPLSVRSAHRFDGTRPGEHLAGYGLRVARTLP